MFKAIFRFGRPWQEVIVEREREKGLGGIVADQI